MGKPMSTDEFKGHVAKAIDNGEALAALFTRFHQELDALIGSRISAIGLRQSIMREAESAMLPLIVTLAVRLS
jgi:hypothetical protein